MVDTKVYCQFCIIYYVSSSNTSNQTMTALENHGLMIKSLTDCNSLLSVITFKGGCSQRFR